MDTVDFYRSYHTNPHNKLIHLFCIPLIVLTSINFLSLISTELSVPYINIRFRSRYVGKLPIAIHLDFIRSLYIAYFFFMWNWRIGFIMQCYITFLNSWGKYWRDNDKKWVINNIKVFMAAWIMQFIGHAIEGNRPALLTSLQQSIFQAPLFTLEYIYPPLLQN